MDWCEGPHGSVTQRRILSAPTCVFMGLFSIAESYLVDPASLSQRLIRVCLSSHCSTVKQPMAQ